VHAILRRLDDDFCDPVELRADSALGVPGLIAVVRAGKVVLANALGSGVLESAAWMGFMPAAAQRLLGERSALPSVATWWCGEQLALDYVIENIERLVVKPAYPNQNFERCSAAISTRKRAPHWSSACARARTPMWRRSAWRSRRRRYGAAAASRASRRARSASASTRSPRPRATG
jgi:uncharacterized circularly permuted ATP-grasp superfamily protein